jgi:phosphoglycolate phosphatase
MGPGIDRLIERAAHASPLQGRRARGPPPYYSPMHLVLFDIDGTLLTAGGSGRRAIHRALREAFGSTGPDDYWFDGKTDRQIVRDLMRSDGHDDAVIDASMDVVLSRYLECLHEELRDPERPPRLCAGVSDLLDSLEARSDVVVGLLTGNVELGARAKLEAAGLDPSRFVVGAFGSDHEHRPRLPAFAQQRARERLGLELVGSAVVVIGDTPADIACGQGIGARAIGVATGRYTTEQLRACGASAVFEDLAGTEAVVAEIVAAADGRG